MKQGLFIWLIIFCAGCLQPAPAQIYTRARTLTAENGLSDNSVNCFYKDATGYIWIGTRHGLNRYNGHAFKVFKPAAGNSISNEFINSVAGEKDGTIWVATMNGLNYYKPSENSWQVIMPGEISNKADLPNNLVWDIQFDEEGLLWIASDVFEFSSYNTKTKQFTYYDWPAFAKTLPARGTGYASIQKFVQRSRNQFWLGTTKGLVLLDISAKQFKWLGAGFNSSVSGLVYDAPSGKVFLSAEEGKCFVYDEKEKTYLEIFPEAEPYPSTAFAANRNSELWLPSANGLLKIAGESVRWAKHIPAFSESLLPGAVRSVYKDDMGLRWIGTTNGVAIYDRDRSAGFIPLLPVSEKVGANNMGGVCYDRVSNSYFIASLQPAAVFIVPADGSGIRTITKDIDGKPFPNCNNVYTDQENNCWLLTDRNVYRFDRSQQQFVIFPTPNRNENVGFRNFMLDEKGDYWFGSFTDGIYHYRVKEDRYDTIPFIFLPFSKKIGSLHYDQKSRSLWISAFSSDVIRYDVSTGKMEGYEDRAGLSALNMVNDIITDHRGHTWMATASAGIFRLDSNKKNWRHYDMQTGLPGNSFMSLCEDGAGNIWLLSERGIDVIDSSGKHLPGKNNHRFNFSTYTSDTRSPHTIFYNKTKNEIVAAVGGGLLIIPAGNNQQQRPFNVMVTSIRAGNRDTAEEKSTYEFSQRLPYHYNLLHFDFAGLYYGAPEDILYEYKLTGYDQHWTRSNNFNAFYQNLPAGNYFFQVRARYRNGQLAGETKGYSFSIEPPFWKTNLFIAGIVLLICAAIGWLIYSLMQKLKAEKILHSFAASLYSQNSIEDICWDTARNCVLKLGFTDCVIYWYEEDRQLLVQKAAYGPKNPWQREIYNSLAIPLGKGIVGSVALSGKMEVIKDTSKDPRYIVDDEKRFSEITVPVFVDEKLFGVIDSEHPQRNFFTRHHARLLRKIAAICGERIARYLAEERLRGKIARDLHDEMGSTLTSINIMSKVAMEGMPAGTPVKDYLQKIKDNSGRILESIGDMVWVINPANDNFEKLLFRMKEFTGEMLEPLKINYHFHEQGILQSVQLNVEQRKEIYMIFKEAVTNAAKYSGTAELFITLIEGNGMLGMEITDKGAGFDAREVTQGNGLKNMKTRAAQIGATLHIESMKGRGTTIIFNLPSPHQGMIS